MCVYVCELSSHRLMITLRMKKLIKLRMSTSLQIIISNICCNSFNGNMKTATMYHVVAVYLVFRNMLPDVGL